MRKFLFLIAGALALMLPASASAAPVSFQGANASMTVVFSNMSGGGFHRGAMVQKNRSRAANMGFMFDNVSSVVSNGSVSYPNGFSMSFSGIGIASNANRMEANLQVSGVMPLDSGVTYDPSTGTYTGSGSVVEFTGAALLDTMMSSGRLMMGGTPGVGTSSMGGGMGSGGGMGGYGPGSGSGRGRGRVPAGVTQMWVTPSSANEITVTDGTPDRSDARPVLLRITMPAFKVTGSN